MVKSVASDVDYTREWHFDMLACRGDAGNAITPSVGCIHNHGRGN